MVKDSFRETVSSSLNAAPAFIDSIAYSRAILVL